MAVLAGGCVVDGDHDDDLEATAGDVSAGDALGKATQELTHMGEVYWTQGSPDIGLGSINDRVCFLTGVRGNLSGSNESVRVYANNGSWWLGGTSSQTGVAAWAACVYTTPDKYTPEYFWSTTLDYPKLMGSATGRICFITGVAGGFNDSSNWVHAYVSGGDWYLMGGTDGPYVNVRARCAEVPGYGPQITRTATATGSAPIMGTGADAACGLVKIWGPFDSSADVVHCDLTTDTWYLTATGKPGVGVLARSF